MTDDSENQLNDDLGQDVECIEQEESATLCNRRHVLKLAALTTGLSTAGGGAISMSSAPVRAATLAGNEVADTFDTADIQYIPPNSLEHIKFDGDTEFTLNWEDLNRGEVIELRMFVKLAEVVDGSGNPTYAGGDFDKVGQMGIRVQEETNTSGYTVKGTDFFENRDYIPVTEKTDIDPKRVDVAPEDPEQCEITEPHRKSKFIIKIKPDAPGLSTDDAMKWGMVLDIKANLGFGHYFGCEFGEVTNP